MPRVLSFAGPKGGDGINDASALAAATISVTISGHGIGISVQAADIVVLVDNGTWVAYAIETRQRIAKQRITPR